MVFQKISREQEILGTKKGFLGYHCTLMSYLKILAIHMFDSFDEHFFYHSEGFGYIITELQTYLIYEEGFRFKLFEKLFPPQVQKIGLSNAVSDVLIYPQYLLRSLPGKNMKRLLKNSQMLETSQRVRLSDSVYLSIRILLKY